MQSLLRIKKQEVRHLPSDVSKVLRISANNGRNILFIFRFISLVNQDLQKIWQEEFNIINGKSTPIYNVP